MKYTIDKQEQYVILTIQTSNFNTSIAPEVKTALTLLLNEGHCNLIMDLSEVAYVDSSGLSAMLAAQRNFTTQGSFVIAGKVSEHVRKLIAISRLDDIFVLIPTLQEAIDYVLMEEMERQLNQENE